MSERPTEGCECLNCQRLRRAPAPPEAESAAYDAGFVAASDEMCRNSDCVLPANHAGPCWEGGFHWRDGWWFKRFNNGGVQVRYSIPVGSAVLKGTLVIPPNEWVSIVASMTRAGESETWHEIDKLHGGTP